MKILVCGDASNLVEYISEKFVRESHTVYQISDVERLNRKTSHRDQKHIVYDVELTSEFAKSVVINVNPDLIIFLGANDEGYDWEKGAGMQTGYLAGLINILQVAADLRINRFIYLSDYGILAPGTVRDISIATGETVCRHFRDTFKLDVIILRIQNIYGIPKRVEYVQGALLDYCRQALQEKSITLKADRYDQYTYITDAVQAIYLAAVKTNINSEVYNVSGGRVVSGEEIAGIIQAEAEPDEVTVIPDGELVFMDELDRIPVENREFGNEFAFSEFIDIQTGTKRLFTYISKNLKNFPLNPDKTVKEPNRKKSDLKFILRSLFPFIENLFLLMAASFATYLTGDVTYLKNIDFMLLYVVLIAVSFGKQHSALAVLAAGVAYTAMEYISGSSVIDVFIDYNFAIRLLMLFTISILVGNLRDDFKQKILEKDETIRADENEIEELKDIYETTLSIKNVLEERLFNYGDGLAKIYSIVSELEGVMTQQILLKAVDVVSRIMNSDSIGIYYCTENSGFCRMVSSSQRSLGRKTIEYVKVPEFQYAISKREVFVNKELKENLPMMASPIFRGKHLIAIIMIWEMEFERLNPYQTNLFSVLTSLITNALDRALVYMEATNEQKLVEGTSIYTFEAMEEFLKISQDAMEEHQMAYTVLAVDTAGRNYQEVSEKLGADLRLYDYLGLSKSGALIILLSNTTKDEAQFLMNRLVKKNINTVIVEDEV